MTAHGRLIAALRTHGCQGRARDWQCPAHDDNRASLRVTPAADRVLLRCFAGCDTEDVLAALGLAKRDLFDEPKERREEIRSTFDYVDEDGELVFQVVRFYPKDFRQRRPDGNGGWTWNLNGTRRVLYRLPRLVEALAAGQTIHVVEGEKDVHAVEQVGGVATTNPGGAGKWRDEYSAALAGADVVVVADKDEPGRKHGREVRDSLLAHGATVRLVEAAVGKDAADHLGAGYGLDAFVSMDTGTATGLRLTRALCVRSRRVVWVLEDAVPLGNTTLVAGPAGLAKTTLLCDWAARITRGEMPGAFHGHPRDAILVSGEDSIASTLKPRCEAAGADLDRVHFVEFGDEGFAIPGDLDRMRGALSSAPEAVFFGVDPLMAFVEDRIDSHKDHHIRRAFSALKRFAEEAGLAVVVISHLNKSESRDFLSRVAGSVGIGAAVRSAFAVVERPDSQPDERERLLVHVKANLGPYKPTQRFRVESRTSRRLTARTSRHPGWRGSGPTNL